MSMRVDAVRVEGASGRDKEREMRRVVVTNNLTLDGVRQAPGRPDEDRRGGFEHGGWAVPYNDEVMGRVMAERMANAGSLVLGRRTYEDFYGYWPKQTDNPFTPVLNETTKYVASTTLSEPLPWQNSVLLEGDAAVLIATYQPTEQPAGR
jgi:dihydrofolate reductase